LVSRVLHECRELVDRHLETSQRKWARECDDVLRALPAVATVLVLGRTHRERSGRHHDHVRAFLAVRKAAACGEHRVGPAGAGVAGDIDGIFSARWRQNMSTEDARQQCDRGKSWNEAGHVVPCLIPQSVFR
jgi:hypothetical protein